MGKKGISHRAKARVHIYRDDYNTINIIYKICDDSLFTYLMMMLNKYMLCTIKVGKKVLEKIFTYLQKHTHKSIIIIQPYEKLYSHLLPLNFCF